MPTVPLPLIQPIGARNATISSGVPAKDSVMVNCFPETDLVHGKILVKRPGVANVTVGVTLGTGVAQGITSYRDYIYEVRGDTLTTVIGTSYNNSASGTGTWDIPGTMPSEHIRAAMVVFNDVVYVIGGCDYFSTVYTASVSSTSDGGVTWTVSTPAAPFGKRAGCSATVFNGKMYVIGGYDGTTWFNDVWSSEDGTNWTLENSNCPWFGRWLHGAVSFNNGIYIVGGASGYIAAPFQLQDVWFSSDGSTWKQTGSTGSARSNFGLVVFPLSGSPAMWMVGGWDLGVNHYKDVYTSLDGIAWNTASTTGLPATGISQFGCVVYANKMWILGGGSSGATTYKTARSSSDGLAWTTTNSAIFSYVGLYQISAVVAKGWSNRNSLTMIIGPGNIEATAGVFGYFLGCISAPLDTAISISTALSPTTSGQRYQFGSLSYGDSLLLKNQSNFWVVNGNSVKKIDDKDYPATTVPGLVVLDQYVFVMDSTGTIYNSNLEVPVQWSALDFIQAIYADDVGVCLAKYMNYVVAFKTTSAEFFVDSGNPLGSPLSHVPNASIRVGCACAASVVNIANTLIFIGQAEGSGRTAMVMNGMQPTPISNTSIDRILEAADLTSNTNGVTAYCLNKNGHSFYILNLKNSGITMVYDLKEQWWHVWTTNNGSGSIGYFKYVGTASAGGIDYLQPETTAAAPASLGKFDTNTYQDAGAAMAVYSITSTMDFGSSARKFLSRLTLSGDTSATAPVVSVFYSDDDVTTVTSPRTIDLSRNRASLWRLGSFFRRAFYFFCLDNVPVRLFRADLEINAGEDK